MLTTEEVKEKYPKIYQSIFDEGQTAGLKQGTGDAFKNGETAGYDKGMKEGITKGAEAERNRIKDVEAQCLPGHENLIAELKYDGKTTGGEAAVQILRAENVMREVKKTQLESDAEGISVDAATPPDTKEKQLEDKDLPIGERAKKKWDSAAELRTEFLEDFDTYLAFAKADEKGSVRILRGKD